MRSTSCAALVALRTSLRALIDARGGTQTPSPSLGDFLGHGVGAPFRVRAFTRNIVATLARTAQAEACGYRHQLQT